MPVTALTQATQFHTAYDRVGWYVTDDTRVPFYNPADSDLDFLPGEPVLIKWGASGDEEVMMVQDVIRPGQLGFLVRHFTADFACNFSANVILGDEVMWDLDNDVLSLAADVTNGFVVGRASYPLSSNPVGLDTPSVDGNDRVICATSSSTKVRVVSMPNVAVTTKGTVTIY